VFSLWYFIEKTRALRSHLGTDHTLFLGNIEDEVQANIISVSQVTVANWVKKLLAGAGIDTSIYKAHSLRSASSTYAVQQGISIQEVKKDAHWSLSSDTFEQYYYRPANQHIHEDGLSQVAFFQLLRRK
jgi:site-specific recombinase XerD